MLRSVLLAAALLAGVSCSLAADVAPFKDTSRLVSIGGSLTEVIYALGEGSRLVARDTTATYPEAARHLPDIGYMRALSAEGVLSVNPSAILAVEGSGPPEALAVLAAAGVPYLQVPESFSHQGILDKVMTVGIALGVPDKAKALAETLDAQLRSVEAITAEVKTPKRILFVLSVQDGKLMASGTGTAADGVIRLAGATNAVAAYAGYKLLNDEAVIAARPDVVLMMANAGDHTTDGDAVLSNPGIAQTPAGAHKALIHMDGSYLLGFGPRTPEALLELVHRLYPELAGD